MGNCVGMQKPVVTTNVDDDDFWGAACGPRCEKKKKKKSGGSAGAAAGGSAGEIKKMNIKMKVKMSKQQLEELLWRADEGNELPLQQVLAGLVSIQCRERQERHWRPRLQSIPELPE